MKVSKLAAHLKGSEIIKIAGKVNELKSQGAQIANLTIGDLNANLYPIPEKLKQNISEAYQENLTNYPVAQGQPSLRNAIAQDLKSRWGLDYSTDEIVITAGARPVIYSIYNAIVDPGDKVVFPAPSWNNNHYCYLSSAQSVKVETQAEHNFLPTAEELAPHLSGAVLLALCSPLNPTGTAFTKDQLKAICELVLAENKKRSADEKPLYLLYDQIYGNLTFGAQHYSPVSLVPELKEYTIYVDGISKCLAATGVRVGWGFGPQHIISKMTAFLTHIGAWSPKPEQEATAKFYEATDSVNSFIEAFKPKIQASLEVLYQGMQDLKEKGFQVEAMPPMGAFYLTLKFDYIGKIQPDGKKIENSTDLAFYLIQEAGAAFVPFAAFGRDDEDPWFRASVGSVSQQEVEAIFPRIEKALTQLK